MKDGFLEEVQRCLQATPCTLRPVQIPVGIDEDLSAETSDRLPAPLLPSIVK